MLTPAFPQAISEEDISLANAIVQPLVHAMGGQLPLLISVDVANAEQPQWLLPVWVNALIVALHHKYGDIYYSFAVNHVLQALLMQHQPVDVPPDVLNSFWLTVNHAMKKPEEAIH